MAASLNLFSQFRKFQQVKNDTYALESEEEYWFAILFCEMMDPTGALKMVLGVNLPRGISSSVSTTFLDINTYCRYNPET